MMTSIERAASALIVAKACLSVLNAPDEIAYRPRSGSWLVTKGRIGCRLSPGQVTALLDGKDVAVIE